MDGSPLSPPARGTEEFGLSADAFLGSLVQAGLLEEDVVRRTARKLGGAGRGNCRALADEFVRRRLLTSFQAGLAGRGQAHKLVLGNYVLLEHIGSGGMGRVYKARHRRMERIVALKTLPPELAESSRSLERFQREVKAAARLSHPNIVAAFDADESQGVHFLVMEYVEGTDLRKLVQGRGPLTLQQAVSCVNQAARGLAHAHQAGIIHRDIKPANLLLGSDGVVKVLDMGLARMDDLAGKSPRRELTRLGAVVGTCQYVSPEQALGNGQIDLRTDIYSLGCTLYYLLTGQPPYAGDSTSILMAHQTAPIPSVLASRPELPTAIDALLQRMLAKKPDERFASMKEVRSALKAFSGGKGGRTADSTDVPIKELQPIMVQPQPSTAGGRGWRLGAALAAILLTAGYLVLQFRPDLATSSTPAALSIPTAGKKEASTTSTSLQSGSLDGLLADLGKLLQQKNPGFDGRLTGREEQGVLVELAIYTDQVSDLSPLAGLKGLQRLTCRGEAWGKGQLVDLSPLHGLKLLMLDCRSNNQLTSLAPLAGMPLTHLHLDYTGVADLAPLKGMPLQSLSLGGSKVQDLGPLAGMPLQKLDLKALHIQDLRLLAQLPLKELVVSHNPHLRDLSILKGLALTSLDCRGLLVADLAPLKGMPLRTLQLDGTQVKDLSPLRGSTLESLTCPPLTPRDLEVLQAIPSLRTVNGKPLADHLRPR